MGRALFGLTHFRALHSIASHFPFCLFPSIPDDTHIIAPLFIVLSAYEHFKTEFNVISHPIQPHECVAYPPSNLLSDLTPHLSLTPH
jgi:hypothetical protein